MQKVHKRPMGVTLIGPEETQFPARGAVEALGAVAGQETFVFSPTPEGAWVVMLGDAEALAGAKVLGSGTLQSEGAWTLISGGDFFAVKVYGYKRRSSEIRAWSKGQVVGLSAPLMMAMGLIEAPQREQVDTTPPALSGALADALRSSGLA